jgi:hypothetical protein
MAYPSVAHSDYAEWGKLKDLELIGEPPSSVRTPVRWRCIRCGTVHTKTLRAVRQAKHGCSCHKDAVLPISEYHALGRRLGIEWAGDLRPRNTKTDTLWRNIRTGKVISASYYALAYHHINIPIRKELGILVWVNLPNALRLLIKELKASEVPYGPSNIPIIQFGDISNETIGKLWKMGIISQMTIVNKQVFVFSDIGRRLLTEAARLDGSYRKKHRIATLVKLKKAATQ